MYVEVRKAPKIARRVIFGDHHAAPSPSEHADHGDVMIFGAIFGTAPSPVRHAAAVLIPSVCSYFEPPNWDAIKNSKRPILEVGHNVYAN